MELLPITIVKSKKNAKPDKDDVKIKLRRDSMSEKPDLYEFKMALFDNGELEKFFLFIWNFQMTLEVLVTLADSEKIHYLCMQLCGKTLLQLDTLSIDVGSTTAYHLNPIF